MPNKPKRKTSYERPLHLSLTKEMLEEIDSAITTNPALEGYNRTGFVKCAILYALDSISECRQQSTAENKEPCHIAIPHQNNESKTNTEFASYIHVVGEDSVPRGICVFGLFGGYERWTTIQVPANILSLPVGEQLEHVPELTKPYLKEHGGHAPFFGAVTGFVYVRELDYYEMDQNGLLVGHIDKVFSRGSVSVSIE